MRITADTQWKDLTFASLLAPYDRRRHRHPTHLYSALLTPLLSGNDGTQVEHIDWDGFYTGALRCVHAGFTIVPFADTGFGVNFSTEVVAEGCRRLRAWFPTAKICGAVIVKDTPDSQLDSEGYQRRARAIRPYVDQLMFMQSFGLTGLRGDDFIAAVRDLTADYPDSILHELDRRFAKFARECTPYEFLGVIKLPNIRFGKLSSLSGSGFFRRLALIGRSDVDARYVQLSGDDWRIREGFQYGTRYGNGILMGAAYSEPSLYAAAASFYERGLLAEFNELITALELLAGVQFRPYSGIDSHVGCYRESTLRWMQLIGAIRRDAVIHPQCRDQDHRDPWETALLEQIKHRLDIVCKDFKIGRITGVSYQAPAV